MAVHVKIYATNASACITDMTNATERDGRCAVLWFHGCNVWRLREHVVPADNAQKDAGDLTQDLLDMIRKVDSSEYFEAVASRIEGYCELAAKWLGLGFWLTVRRDEVWGTDAMHDLRR